MSTFAEQVAEALLAEASALGARWQTQTRIVAPRVRSRTTPAHGVLPSPSPQGPSPASTTAAAAAASPAIINALACALRNVPRCQDGVLRAGWDYGAASYLGGAALHHVVKELDLLAAMALYVAEQRAEGADASAAEAVRVARRLNGVFAALRLAASKGYTHQATEEMRARYRALRHDLRNPLGTIRNAVSLMDDESLPAEVRYSARYRAMVVRNATSLDALIGIGLSDEATEFATLSVQEVSLHDIARSVRREMREEAEVASCAITLAPSLAAPALPSVFIDSAAFELVLRSVVSVALARARPGSTVDVALHARHQGAAVVAVVYEPANLPAPRTPHDGGLAFAESLARRAGGRVWREGVGTVLLEVPIVEGVVEGVVEGMTEAEPPRTAAAAADRAVERETGAAGSAVRDDLPGGGGPPPPRSSRQAGDDLAGARQGDHR